jgi:hypothetical protein
MDENPAEFSRMLTKKSYFYTKPFGGSDDGGMETNFERWSTLLERNRGNAELGKTLHTRTGKRIKQDFDAKMPSKKNDSFSKLYKKLKVECKVARHRHLLGIWLILWRPQRHAHQRGGCAFSNICCLSYHILLL